MKNSKELPVVFIRGLVVFPGMSVTITIGREASRIAVLESQNRFSGVLITMTQLRAEDPEIKTLNSAYKVGTVCKIEKAIVLTDGGMQVQIEGLERIEAQSMQWQDKFPIVKGNVLADTDHCTKSVPAEMFTAMSSYQPVNFDEVVWITQNDPEKLSRLNQRISRLQKILEEPSVDTRAESLKAFKSDV